MLIKTDSQRADSQGANGQGGGMVKLTFLRKALRCILLSFCFCLVLNRRFSLFIAIALVTIIDSFGVK